MEFKGYHIAFLLFYALCVLIDATQLQHEVYNSSIILCHISSITKTVVPTVYENDVSTSVVDHLLYAGADSEVVCLQY